MTQGKKPVRMLCVKAIHFTLMIGMMAAVWAGKYAPDVALENVRIVSTAVLACYILLAAFLYQTYNVYKIGMYRVGETFYSMTLANLLSAALTYLFACLIQMRLLNCLPMVLMLAVQTAISGLWCFAANYVYFRQNKPMKTLVIYKCEEDMEKLGEIVFFEKRFEVVGKVKAPTGMDRILPGMRGCQAVIISGIEESLRNEIITACIEQRIECFFIPHIGDMLVSGAEHVQSFSIPIMEISRVALSPEYAFIKRAMDIAGSVVALVAASPFMLATAVAIKAYDGGPVLYKQVRLTKDGRRYTILKFRSMCVDAEKDGVARLACARDDRITPVGRVIRAIRFDELPQLFNVLRGEMSLVGPRPERPEIAAQYEKELPAFRLRLQVNAGLTGTAQVYGRYNTEPGDKLKMDLMYINKMSLPEDLRLIFATVKILLMKEKTRGVEIGQTTAEKTVKKSA